MYSEGEDKYLHDLDCVDIVKSIRELRALTRVILDQQQRQLLSFERESVLPWSKAVEQQENEFIHSKVPFDSDAAEVKDKYITEVDKYFSDF